MLKVILIVLIVLAIYVYVLGKNTSKSYDVSKKFTSVLDFLRVGSTVLLMRVSRKLYPGTSENADRFINEFIRREMEKYIRAPVPNS